MAWAPRWAPTTATVRWAGTNRSLTSTRLEPVPCIPITRQSSKISNWSRSRMNWIGVGGASAASPSAFTSAMPM